jgi:iron uptake system component EfeO
VVVVLTLVGLAVSACAGPTGATVSVRRPTRTAVAITEAERTAARAATATFHHDIADASAAFVTAVGQLQVDADHGSVAAARTDELAAQADYDVFRSLADGNPVNASTLDEEAADLTPGQSFGGLHAVERDLWASGDAAAAADISGLAAQAPVAQYLVSREQIDPEAIGDIATDELSWVDDVAVPGREELTSHLDDVDIAATVGAAAQAFAAIEPLATDVAPGATGAVADQFALLTRTVTSLGPPDLVTDSSIPPTARRTLSQQVDATASRLALLAAALVPFGTAGPSS